MTPNDRLKLELFAAKYREAIENDDFDTQAALLEYSEKLPGSMERVLEIHAELEAEQAAHDHGTLQEALSSSVKDHLRSGVVMTAPTRSITFAHVAEELTRKLPATWTAEQQALNDKLRQSTEALPDEMGLSEFRQWMQTNYGTAPESYVQVFCRTAVKVRMRQASMDSEYQLAARRAKQKPEDPK